MNKKVFYILSCWLIIIISMVLYHICPLITGKEVLLEIIPVDPRDFFRGDYVTLNYVISSLPDSDVKYGENVFVTLKTDKNNIAYIDSVEKNKNDINKRLYLKGKVKNRTVVYGIESYFVKEKTGREIERKINSDKKSYARVKISPFGSAKVVELLLNKDFE